MNQQELDFEKTLEDSKMLLEDASRAADEGYEFTLESILSEFGASKEVPKDGLEQLKPAVTVAEPLPELLPDREGSEAEESLEGAELPKAARQPGTEKPQKPVKRPEPEEPPADEANDGRMAEIVPPVDTPQSYSLQEVLSRTVQEVLDEQKSEPVLEDLPPRRGFFFRRGKPADTEDLYRREGQEKQGGEEKSKKKPRKAKSEQEEKESPLPPPEEPEEEEPEPPIAEVVADYRDAMQNARHVSRLAALVTALMWLPPLAAHLGWMPAIYAEEKLFSVLPFFVALTLVCMLGREVFFFGLEKLASFKITYELMTALLCVAALADTGLMFVSGTRNPAALPLHSVAALSMTCALWGRSMLFRSLYDAFRVAAIGDGAYIVTNTGGGASKRSGSTAGFIASAEHDDASSRWQTIILPVILIGALVFSVLATLEAKDWSLFCWNLSAILAGADALAFPLVYSLPLRRLTRRFTASGCALAGYVGARSMSRSNCIILTDTDLFPRGTVSLNGLKVFGEESGKVFSYAATMAHASDTGLSRLFDNLLESEGGHLEPLSDLNYYEEGGVSGTIRGETVLFGTSSFCRKMGVTLPTGLTLKTGMFLAVDGTLIAVFAVKYMAAKSVDWAVHALQRARITPVLAVRDGNITPELLKRKFGTDARAVYPELSTRLALSGKTGEKPSALIYREGLLPYAELAVGSKRLCRAVAIGNVLSLIASVAGTMISFYLCFVAAYTLFTPPKLLAFLCLWGVAALIDGLFVDKY